MIPIPTQTPDQNAIAYGLALLHFAARYGTDDWTLAQLEQADRVYPIAIAGYGRDVESVAHCERMTAIRRRILAAIDAQKARQAEIDQQLREWLAAVDQGDQDAQDADQANQQPEPDPRDQAIRLMRAALQMIQDPGATRPPQAGSQDSQDSDDTPGGGSRVPRVPIAPRFPPGGAQAIPGDDPTYRQGNGTTRAAFAPQPQHRPAGMPTAPAVVPPPPVSFDF